ncbi:MAG: hypothetical protein PHT79_00385 [Syntrophomonadaceae bacterium]|nr:hypothetical protein [Syntrophomonadaceae bacterium]MDD3888814.1 hypothetical protein [Syntrophomonadaceae bacterium]MDD4548211.1 hypothetical protein [Syntrophomonadaceae bacterium]
MLSGFMDYKNSIAKKIINEDKIDPGTFSFLGPGWWALHAAAISAIYVIGHTMAKNMQKTY